MIFDNDFIWFIIYLHYIYLVHPFYFSPFRDTLFWRHLYSLIFESSNFIKIYNSFVSLLRGHVIPFLLENSAFPYFSPKFSSNTWGIISGPFIMISEYLKKYKVSPSHICHFVSTHFHLWSLHYFFNFLFLAFSPCHPCSFQKYSFCSLPWDTLSKRSYNSSLFSGHCLRVCWTILLSGKIFLIYISHQFIC